MDYNSIYVQGLQEALVEKEKATAAVKGLIERIADVKREQLSRFIKEKRPFVSEGFVFVGVSIDVSEWRSDAFRLEASFLLKDIKVPKGATPKEIKLMNEYKELVKDVDWDGGYWLSKYVGVSEKVDQKLRYLKNGIEVMKTCEWGFSYSDILEGESFFRRGFSFRED